jgi:nicotinamidase-related amidase
MITSSDFESGKWSTKVPDPKLRSYVSGYLKSLEAKNRYAHTIWPEHCLIGSWGHGIHEELYNSLLGWERQYTAMVNTVTKGSNYLTEHFSAVMAENPIPEDPSTHINTRLIQALEEADTLVVAGQALSHCVANTIIDVSKNFSDPALMSKVVLLEDCTSEVPNPPGLTVFSDFTKKFLSDMKSLGMRTAKSTEFLV